MFKENSQSLMIIKVYIRQGLCHFNFYLWGILGIYMSHVRFHSYPSRFSSAVVHTYVNNNQPRPQYLVIIIYLRCHLIPTRIKHACTHVHIIHTDSRAHYISKRNPISRTHIRAYTRTHLQSHIFILTHVLDEQSFKHIFAYILAHTRAHTRTCARAYTLHQLSLIYAH